MTAAPARPVFFVSDRTGITAETLGSTLLTQFDSGWAEHATLPFIDTDDKAQAARERAEAAGRAAGAHAIVFSTTVSEAVRELLRGGDYLFIDLFDAFEPSLERALQAQSQHLAGRAHGMSNAAAYEGRIEAMNYALAHDDGLGTASYERAQVIVVAPSRCGKTPVCLYLAMQFGVFAANYPLTEDDFERDRPPPALASFRDKLYGLWITPERLQSIRSERRRDSRYASIAQVSYELREADALYRRLGLPFAETTNKSIEEIAALVMQSKNLRRHAF